MFFTHHRRPPLILCCRSGLGVTFSLAGEQTLGKASLSRDSLPALGERTVSLALGKPVPPPLLWLVLAVRGELLLQGSRSLGK